MDIIRKFQVKIFILKSMWILNHKSRRNENLRDCKFKIFMEEAQGERETFNFRERETHRIKLLDDVWIYKLPSLLGCWLWNCLDSTLPIWRERERENKQEKETIFYFSRNEKEIPVLSPNRQLSGSHYDLCYLLLNWG